MQRRLCQSRRYRTPVPEDVLTLRRLNRAALVPQLLLEVVRLETSITD
jgi:hypothetical protein